MKMITLGYREQLPHRDILFITRHLAHGEAEINSLMRLLTDPQTVDEILDLPALYQLVLDSIEYLQMSPRLYFYILVRNALLKAGITDAELADYLSGVLEVFGQEGVGKCGTARGVFYVIDWLQQLEQAPPEDHFELYVMAGNRLLFLTGIFPGFLRERTRRRGAPSLEFYEQVGRHFFNSASLHPLSRLCDTDELYGRLADSFTDLRHVLNDFSSRLVFLES